MLSPSLVAEVRRLLAEGGHTQRQISARTGVSRGSVSAIASGKRPDRAPAQPAALNLFDHTRPKVRCPGCGALVCPRVTDAEDAPTPPCRACEVRSQAAAQPRRPAA